MVAVFVGVPQVSLTFSLLMVVSYSLMPLNRNATQYSLSCPSMRNCRDKQLTFKNLVSSLAIMFLTPFGPLSLADLG